PAHVIPQTAPADFVPWLVILKPFADGREQAAGLVLDRCKDVGPLLEHGDVLSLAFGDDGVDGGLLVASLKIPDLSADRGFGKELDVQWAGMKRSPWLARHVRGGPRLENGAIRAERGEIDRQGTHDIYPCMWNDGSFRNRNHLHNRVPCCDDQAVALVIPAPDRDQSPLRLLPRRVPKRNLEDPVGNLEYVVDSPFD